MVRCLCNLHEIIKALHKTGFKHRVKPFLRRSALLCLLSGYEVRFLFMRVMNTEEQFSAWMNDQLSCNPNRGEW